MELLIGFLFLVLGAVSIVKPKAVESLSRVKLIGIFYVLIGFIIIISSSSNTLKVESQVVIPAGTATLTGEVICLPHKDTSGPQTMECAFGLHTDSGLNYALDYGTNYEAIPQTGTTVTVTGHVTPVQALSTDQWQKYDMVGIISVE